MIDIPVGDRGLPNFSDVLRHMANRGKVPLPTASRSGGNADALASMTAERDAALAIRWTPTGDNHHNAWLCPHCNVGSESPQKMLAEIKWLRAELRKLAITVERVSITGNRLTTVCYCVACTSRWIDDKEVHEPDCVLALSGKSHHDV